jgi:hypothetical protein
MFNIFSDSMEKTLIELVKTELPVSDEEALSLIYSSMWGSNTNSNQQD